MRLKGDGEGYEGVTLNTHIDACGYLNELFVG